MEELDELCSQADREDKELRDAIRSGRACPLPEQWTIVEFLPKGASSPIQRQVPVGIAQLIQEVGSGSGDFDGTAEAFIGLYDAFGSRALGVPGATPVGDSDAFHADLIRKLNELRM